MDAALSLDASAGTSINRNCVKTKIRKCHKKKIKIHKKATMRMSNHAFNKYANTQTDSEFTCEEENSVICRFVCMNVKAQP